MKTIILPATVIAAIAAAFLLSALSPELRAQESVAKRTAVRQLEWEYRALRIDDRQRSGGREGDVRARRSASQETLNQLGAEGWELVAVRTDPAANNNTLFYFKRPKR